jgi:hypothetical protein
MSKQRVDRRRVVPRARRWFFGLQVLFALCLPRCLLLLLRRSLACRKSSSRSSSMSIRCNHDYRVDPITDDFYARLVDLRAEVRPGPRRGGTSRSRARSTARERAARPEDHRQRDQLRLLHRALPRDLSRLEICVAFGLDGDAFPTPLRCHEHPSRRRDSNPRPPLYESGALAN